MKVLRLMSCNKCTSLPSLGKLVSLKELAIKGMTGVRSVSSEICGESLENLCLENLQDWEYWDSMQENGSVSRFSCLRQLAIKNCPKLSGNFPKNLTLLEELKIEKCTELVVTLSNLPKLCNIEIDGCKKVSHNDLVYSKQVKFMKLSSISDSENSLIQGLQNVDFLKIESCDDLIHTWQSDLSLRNSPKGLLSLTFLSKLCIYNCPNLDSIPDACFPPVLNKLEILCCAALTSLPKGITLSCAKLNYLRIADCYSLLYIAKGQLPACLKELHVEYCRELQYLFDDKENLDVLSSSSFTSSPTDEEHANSSSITTALELLSITACHSLTCLFPDGMLPTTLKYLSISSCLNLTSLTSGGQLPKELQSLEISGCPKLESIAERFYNNNSLEYSWFGRCENLKSIPDGLHDLGRLCQISIYECQSLVSFPQGGLPSNISTVYIRDCEYLQSPPNGFHNLNSLFELTIEKCPCITLYPEEGLPTSLTTLEIEADVNFYKPLTEWGLHKLTKLKTLKITGCQDAVSFPEEENSMSLPSSLTDLRICGFPELKHLSSKGFRNLLCLESLWISDCGKLKYLPKEGLPSSLLELRIYYCPLLEERYKRDKGRKWHKIAHIPLVKIVGKN